MILSQNQKIFLELFSAFSQSPWNLEYFFKKDDPLKLFVSEIIDCMKRGYLNAEKGAYQNTYGQSTC